MSRTVRRRYAKAPRPGSLGNMSMVRKLVPVVIVVMALSLAACTTSSVKPTGVIRGYADACEGLALQTGQTFHVKVSLYSGSTPVASVTIRSGAKYRFSVSPGAYQVKGWWGSKAVTVRTSHVVTVNIVDFCK